MLLITKVGSPTLLGLTALPALGACGGAFALGFFAFGFLAGAALLDLAGLAAGAESGRIGRGEDGRAIGLARGFSIVVQGGVGGGLLRTTLGATLSFAVPGGWGGRDGTQNKFFPP